MKKNKDDLIKLLVLDGAELQKIIDNNNKLIKEQEKIINNLINDNYLLHNELIKFKINLNIP
jgi:hypothetical protein